MPAVTYATEGYPVILAAMIEGLVARLRLYVNDPPVTPSLSHLDLVEASFDGYDGVDLVRWTPPALRAGVAVSMSDLAEFHYTGPGPGEAIRGAFVTEGQGGALLWATRWEGEPLVVGPESTLLLVATTLNFPANPEARSWPLGR